MGIQLKYKVIFENLKTIRLPLRNYITIRLVMKISLCVYLIKSINLTQCWDKGVQYWLPYGAKWFLMMQKRGWMV